MSIKINKINKINPICWNGSKENSTCMSYTGTKTKDQKRCSRTVKNCSDFCGYHNRSQKYYQPLLKQIYASDVKSIKDQNENIKKIKSNIKLEIGSLCTNYRIKLLLEKIVLKVLEHTNLLDKNHLSNLMMLEESWSSVPINRRIKLSDGWWDVDIIVNHFTQQLNNNDMGNPYPVYLKSPFTRTNYRESDVHKLKMKLILLKKPINIALKSFITLEDWVISTMYNEANDTEGVSQSLLNYLSNKLRYKYINCKNSQDNYTGYWVSKTTPLNKFEKLHKTYCQTMWQEFNYDIGLYFINEKKLRLQRQMDALPKEEWSVVTDNTKSVI